MSTTHPPNREPLMSLRPAHRTRRASASPLFTPHGTDRAGRKAARRQLAEAAAKARSEAAGHAAGTAPTEHKIPAPSTRPADGPAPHRPAETGSGSPRTA